MNLDDAPRWYGKRIDKEIGIMSARSVLVGGVGEMGRDIADSRRTDDWQ